MLWLYNEVLDSLVARVHVQMNKDSLDKLTENQKQCLRLVNEGLEAKEIAHKLLISPHAVIERLRNARRVLEAPTSRSAARFLAEHEGTTSYNRHVAKPIGVELHPVSMPSLTPQFQPQEMALQDDAYVQFKETQAPFFPHTSGRLNSFPLPFPTAGRRHNDLTILQTVLMIVIIAIGLGFAGIASLAIVSELAELHRQ
jgi:DNA-binding CsgD family transcriptional regulator